MGLIISIQTNAAAINLQRASQRTSQAVDFRKVQGSMAGTGVTNLLAGLFGAVPNIINPGVGSFIQTTGVASRRVGYCIGIIFIAVALVPKLSGLFSTIPGPVMTGYLLMVTGTLFAEGARTVIQGESDPQKLIAAGMCFWIGAAFQFGLFHLPDFGPVWAGLFKSGITTGGLAAVAMILYLEFTNPRRMRFHSKLDIEALPDLNDFLARFAARRGWDDRMKERLSQVAEETLLILAPLDLELDLDLDSLDALDDLDGSDDSKAGRRLIVVASSDPGWGRPGVHRQRRRRQHRGPGAPAPAARLRAAGRERDVPPPAARPVLIGAPPAVSRHRRDYRSGHPARLARVERGVDHQIPEPARQRGVFLPLQLRVIVQQPLRLQPRQCEQALVRWDARPAGPAGRSAAFPCSRPPRATSGPPPPAQSRPVSAPPA